MRGHQPPFRSLRRVLLHALVPATAATLAATLAAGVTGVASAAEALEEVIVTATKREASLQETSISITAFAGEEMIDSGIVTTEQLSGFTPGLNIQRDVIGKVVIRGIGTENFTIAGDPGVAINFDGAYIARSSVSIFDMFDMQRVEVLRGPQGTLYGRNATGGAINLISNKPTDTFEFYGLADIGDFSKRRFETAVSGPIAGDQLLGRFSAMYHKRDGYTENIFPGIGGDLDELDNRNAHALRGQLHWAPAENLTVDLKADYYRDRSSPIPYKYTDPVLSYAGTLGADFANPLAGQLRTVSQGFERSIPGFTETVPDTGRWDQWGVTGTVNWDLSDTLTLRSITAYREIDFGWLNDGDGIAPYLVTYFQEDATEQITQEFQLISDSDSRFNWTAGAFFLHEEGDSFIGIPLPSGFDLPFAIIINGSTETTAYALFGEVYFDLTEKLRFTAGARFNYEEKEVAYNDDRSSIFGPNVFVTAEDDWSAITPKFGIDYFMNDDVLLYASATQGFKSGGFNLLAVQPGYDEEDIISLEIGAKTRWMDGRLQLNGSAFYYMYDDLQVGKVVQLNAVIENAAEATIYGAEFELTATPTDNLRFDAGISLLDTEYDAFLSEDKNLPGAPEISLAGNELPRAPNLTSNVSGAWTMPMANGSEFELWGNWQHTGSQFFTPFNRPNFEQESYDVVNARLTYRVPSGNWSVTLYGENLTDEEYFTNALESGVPAAGVDPVVPQFFVGAPRTWGVRVRFDIGN